MPKSLLAMLAASAILVAPAVAEPSISTAMPAIRASLTADGQMVVRLEQGVLGASRSLSPRMLSVVAKDASGAVVYQSETSVLRRTTHARIPAADALMNASTVMVTVR